MSTPERLIGHSQGKCIPFDGIRQYAESHSLQQTIDYAKKTYRRLSVTIYPKAIVEEFPIHRQLLHQLAYSGIAVGAVAAYEYIRIHRPDLSLPDLKPMIPAASMSVSDSEGTHPFGKNTTIHVSRNANGEFSTMTHTERGSIFHHVDSGYEVKDHGIQK
jgi:hypothetical protein